MIASEVKPAPPAGADVCFGCGDTTPTASAGRGLHTNGPQRPAQSLWIIAIGMAWFFGIVAAVMATTAA